MTWTTPNPTASVRVALPPHVTKALILSDSFTSLWLWGRSCITPLSPCPKTDFTALNRAPHPSQLHSTLKQQIRLQFLILGSCFLDLLLSFHVTARCFISNCWHSTSSCLIYFMFSVKDHTSLCLRFLSSSFFYSDWTKSMKVTEIWTGSTLMFVLPQCKQHRLIMQTNTSNIYKSSAYLLAVIYLSSSRTFPRTKTAFKHAVWILSRQTEAGVVVTFYIPYINSYKLLSYVKKCFFSMNLSIKKVNIFQ